MSLVPQMQNPERRRVLLVRPDKIGDLVLSLPVAAVLKARFPGIQVDVLASNYGAPLLAFSPHVNACRLLTHASGAPRNWRDLARELRQERYDVAIFLKPAWRSAVPVFAARIPKRIGTSRRSCAMLFNTWVNNRRKYSGLHETDLNLMLLKPLGVDVAGEIHAPELRVADEARLKTGRDLNLPKGYVVIHCGSGGSAANWGRAAYARLARELHQTGIPIVLTGKESPFASPEDHMHDVTNRTRFDQLVHVLAGARGVVAGSTGPLHIAAALGVPVVGLYPNHAYLGPHRWGPRGARVRVLMPPMQPEHRCLLRSDGSCTCMDRIVHDEVFAAVNELLNTLSQRKG